jgi:hypothetical protein
VGLVGLGDPVERLAVQVRAIGPRLARGRQVIDGIAEAQWIALSDVAQRLGISDDEAEQAVALALERGRIITDGGSPPHSVSLNWGRDE